MLNTRRIKNLLPSASASEPVIRSEMEQYVGSTTGISQSVADMRYLRTDGGGATSVQANIGMNGSTFTNLYTGYGGDNTVNALNAYQYIADRAASMRHIYDYGELTKSLLGQIRIGDTPSAPENWYSSGWLTGVTYRTLTTEIGVYTVSIDRSLIFQSRPFEVMLSWSSNRAASVADIAQFTLVATGVDNQLANFFEIMVRDTSGSTQNLSINITLHRREW